MNTDADTSGALTAPTAGKAPRFARSIHDWAAELGLSYLTIYRAVKSGALPAKRCGRRIIVMHEDVMGWVSKMPPA